MIQQGASSKTTDAFGTNPLVIDRGTTVIWVNCDTVAHTVTSQGNAQPLNSGLIPPGETYTYTFNDAAGTYGYYCQPHPNMTGSVQVR